MRSSALYFFIMVVIIMIGSSSIYAQFYFGRNKIQYEQFEWQVLTTDHFDIYYYSEEEELAYAGASMAEEFFYDLEIIFNHTLDHRIPLVIYSNHIHFQQTNVLLAQIPEGIGGFFEFIKGRVVIPFNGNMDDFHHVIRHELVHVFMHNKILTGINNAGLWNPPRVPLWFSEGLAEWWSEGWNSQAEMVIRDALLYDHLIPLNSVGGFLAYKEGQSFLGFYEQHYGASRIRRIMEEFWIYNSFEEAISAISGKEYDDIMMDWELTLKQKMAKALQNEEIPSTGSGLITEDGINVSPAIYTDHTGDRHVVYIANHDGYTNIYSQALEGKHGRIVVKGERKADLESLHLLQTGISVNSTGVLAFVAKSGSHDVIKLIDIHSLEEVGEFARENLVTIRSPRWSSDGKKIVFSAQDFSGNPDLYLWETNKEFALRLTNDFYSDQDPSFSPDGEWIVFSSDRGRPTLDDGMDLFLLEVSTNIIRYLTHDQYKNTKPRWSRQTPEKIYFISDRTGTPNLWVLTFSDKKISEYDLQINQVSFLHTGVVEAIPAFGDSLLINVFQDYSFQLQHLPITNRDSSKVDSIKIQSPEEPWTFENDKNRVTANEKMPYRLRYSLDFAQTAVAYDPIYGILGGAQLSISDMLGNRYYNFLLANTAQTASEFFGRFNLAVTMVDLTRRTNLALSAFHFANDYYDPYQAFYFERTFGFRMGMSYPFSVFHRLELSTSFWSSSKDFYYGKPESALLLSNFISWVHDNSLWTPIGPIDGWRARITVGPAFDFQRARIHNYTTLIDFRYYYRPVSYLTLAHRAMIWFNDGTDIRRYYIGGSWGIRGYSYSEIYGRKLIMLNQELRFPFANSLALNFSSMSIGLAPIRGALFLDAGNAWDIEFPGFIGSFGFGIRGALFGVLVLRLDVGKRTDFRSISDGWFTQFFFGWDY